MLYKYKNPIKEDNSMDNLFNNVPSTGVETTAAPAVSTPASEGKKEKIAMMKEALRQTVASDPDFVTRVRKLSGSVEVLNSLGFGDSGNIIVDKTKSTKDNRTLAVTSAIVGYRISNIGTEPIKYVTEVWTPDETGKYVPTKTEKVLAPGSYADLTRQYMTMFCAQPEISFQLANGKIIKGSGAKGDKNLKAELESYYFAFAKDADGNKKQINDDDVKLNVGEKVGEKWVVKAEFVEAFGFLNNPKEGGKAGRKPAGEKFNAQDISANFVRQMIENDGM